MGEDFHLFCNLIQYNAICLQCDNIQYAVFQFRSSNEGHASWSKNKKKIVVVCFVLWFNVMPYTHNAIPKPIPLPRYQPYFDDLRQSYLDYTYSYSFQPMMRSSLKEYVCHTENKSRSLIPAGLVSLFAGTRTLLRYFSLSPLIWRTVMTLQWIVSKIKKRRYKEATNTPNNCLFKKST